jgi:putative oxidoreductase
MATVWAMSASSPRRPGTDLPALLLRLIVGPMLLVHGLNKVRGPGGLTGTAGYFESLGLRPAKVHAGLAAGTEIGAGALLAAGALSPLPQAAVIGLMATAAGTDHRGKGFFIFKGGWEYVGVVGAVAAVSALIGPGRISLDALRGRRRSGPGWALVAAALGVAGAAGILSTVRKPEPEPESEPDPLPGDQTLTDLPLS